MSNDSNACNLSVGSNSSGTANDTTSAVDLSACEAALAAAATAILLVASTALNAGLVHYERVLAPDAHRTVVNRLTATAAAYSACAAFLCLVPTLAVALAPKGALGEAACFVRQAVWFASLGSLILVYNEIILVRYLYMCVLSTVGSFNEDFLFLLISVLNPLLSLIFGFLAAVWRGKDHFMMRTCLGMEDYGDPPQVPSALAIIVYVATLLFHVGIGLRLLHERRKVAMADKQQGYLRATLTDLETTLSTCLFLAAYLPASRLARALLWPPGRRGDLALVCSHALALAVVPAVATYARNARLRSALQEEAADAWHGFWEDSCCNRRRRKNAVAAAAAAPVAVATVEQAMKETNL